MKIKKSESIPSSEQLAFEAKHKRHHHIVTFSRMMILVMFLALWETCADLEIIDSFFFSSPSRLSYA